MEIAISGTGIFVPEHKVTNDELVEAFNAHVDVFNAENKADIDAGLVAPKQYSSSGFIEKASGIKSRHFISKSGILDPHDMRMHAPESMHGDEDTPSLQAQMAINAGQQALDQAKLKPEDIDLVVASSAAMQRYFPAMGIEVQKFLGTKGASFDMTMACSSATFGMIYAATAVKSGIAKRALMVNPEIFSTMVNFTDRDSHFIFGDIASACVIEAVDTVQTDNAWRIDDIKQLTQFSNNIRSNYGPMTRLEDDAFFRPDMYFVQQGRKVFKELLPLVTSFIEDQLSGVGLTAHDLKRMWLHQANINMNMYAGKKLLGREPERHEAPVVLEKYGNIAGAGSLVAFHEHRDDLTRGDTGLICSFGAGYSIGGLVVSKL